MAQNHHNRNSKRKLDDFLDDEELSAPGRQSLPIANLPKDFDSEPMDGLEYLFTVRRDARKLPLFTRAPNPYESLPPVLPPPPPSPVVTHDTSPVLPSSEWRSICETRFRNFRINTSQSIISVVTPQVMPNKKERALWWAFLEGKPEAEWNIAKRPHTNKFGGMRAFPSGSGEPSSINQPDVPTTSEVSLPEIPQFQSREPAPQMMLSIDEPMALHLLMYFTHWISQHVIDAQSFIITESHARWIFSLLSRIDDYLSADDMNLLRNLARATISLLKIKIHDSSGATDIIPSKVSQRSCWIILTIIINGWKQHDLWMDAEGVATHQGRPG